MKAKFPCLLSPTFRQCFPGQLRILEDGLDQTAKRTMEEDVNNRCTIREELLPMRDGIRLRCCSWLPGRLRCAVVLIHGAGEHIDRYRHLGPLFVRESIGLISFDLRGFGKSEGRRGHVTRFDEYLEDVDQVVRFFKQTLDGVRFFLVGHSLGGLIVTRYAQTRPDGVDGIVLSAPALGLRVPIPHPAHRIIRLLGQMVPGFGINPYRLIARARQIPLLKRVVTYKVNNKLEDPLVPSRYSFGWVKELFAHTEEAMRHAERVTVPTLCLCGEKDPVIHPDTVRTFYDRMAAANKEWVLFPEAEHRLLHPESPAAAIDALIGWLKRNSAPGGAKRRE